MTPESSASFPFRILNLERRVDAHETELRAVGDRSIQHEAEITGLESAVERLNDTLSKLLWAVVGMAFTVAAAAIGLAMTIGTG